MATRKKKPGRPKLTEAEKRKRARSTKAVNRPSQATGRKPSPRLKRRRRTNVEPGYYPNPDFYIGFVRTKGKRWYYAGHNVLRGHPIFDTDKKRAVLFSSDLAAMDTMLHDIRSSLTKSSADDMAKTLGVERANF